jgi:uracil-DNA glycosylase family 4
MTEPLSRYVPGTGAMGAKLMAIGEAPSFAELEAGRPFVGPAGRQFDALLKDTGISRSSIWTTNVSKYFVPFAPKGKKIPFFVRAKNAGINLEEQISDLVTEIKEVNPNCLLILGGTALEALTRNKGIQDYRGSIIQACGFKSVPTFHPAHLIHQQGSEISGYWIRQIMMFDFLRAKHQSTFPELQLPSRNLQICRNSAQLADFIERNKHAKKLSIDIEALDCIPVCIGLACTHHEGITIPLWNCKGISTIPDADLASVWILLSRILINPQLKKIGQNFKYDEDKISRLGLPIDHLYSDTMLKAFAINPELPKNLAFNTSIYTEEPFYKNEGMYGSFDKKTGKWNFDIHDLFIGCARDACVTLEIDDKMDADLDELGMRPFYENFLMKLHYLYQEIEQEGFRVNEDKRERILKKYIQWRERIDYELFQIVGSPINTGSWKQVQTLLQINWGLRVDSTSEESLTALLNTKTGVTDPAKRRGIELILESRKVKKTIGTYAMAIPDYDGRMRTTYFLCLETGRTSTGQQDPPIRPSVEYHDENNKPKRKSLGTAFQVLTKHGEIGPDIRSMYEADDGEIFIQADSSQAEARVVALLSNDKEMMEMYDRHDIHALTASWFWGGTESDYSKKILGYESPIRFAGKTLRHAGNLGASKRRAAIELNTQARKYKITDPKTGEPFQVTEAFTDAALKIFHARSPSIRGVFHAEIIKSLERNMRVLTAPLPYGIEAPHGGKRTFFERWGEELFRQAFAYIPQRAVSDNTKAAALRIKSRIPWIRIILESHDALLVSVPIAKAEEVGLILIEEMQRPIDFSHCSLPRESLSIPCELESGYNYMDLSKMNLEQEITA